LDIKNKPLVTKRTKKPLFTRTLRRN